MEFYPEIISRYENMLLNNQPFYFDGFDNTENLLWMLNVIRTDTEETMDSLIKKERWLGYVQQAIVSAGLTDFATEREYFKGIYDVD